MQILAIKYLFDKQLDCGPVFFSLLFLSQRLVSRLEQFLRIDVKKKGLR